MFPRLHGFATAITVLTFWIAGGACKKQEGTSGDVAAPQAATPAESEVLAAEPEAGAAEPDAGTAEAVEPEPAKGGCGCMHGEGPHEGCPHHGGDSGAPGGCGCMHGEGSHEG
ncbi:MAG: hypothetical protein GYA57_15175, partial [Myxococcales bacterium]|nr:hypothetical protein [Myxococcales bacterium]